MKRPIYFVIFLAFCSLFSIRTEAQGLVTKQAPLPCIDRTFTVVAHMVRDSFGEFNITQAEILAALDSVNQDFAPICVKFDICAFKDINNFQYDDIEDGDELNELFTYYNDEKRINMYFISSSDQPFCGVATLGGIALPSSANAGIAIIKGDCMAPGTKTMSHEIGHYFGLLHTFEGAGMPGSELVDGANCTTAGDLVCDTPADPYLEGEPADQYVDAEMCRFILPAKDGNGDWFVPDVGNIMSYYQADCSCGFTNGQFIRMANTYLNSDRDDW